MECSRPPEADRQEGEQDAARDRLVGGHVIVDMQDMPFHLLLRMKSRLNNILG